MVLGLFYFFVIKIMLIREWIYKICSLKIFLVAILCLLKLMYFIYSKYLLETTVFVKTLRVCKFTKMKNIFRLQVYLSFQKWMNVKNSIISFLLAG